MIQIIKGKSNFVSVLEKIIYNFIFELLFNKRIEA